MDDFKKFVTKYAGAIIGVLVAIILLCTSLYKFIIWAVVIVACGYFGYYIPVSYTHLAVKSLEKKKYVVIEQKQVERNPFLHKVEKKTSKLKFTDEQQYAYDKISFAMDKNKLGILHICFYPLQNLFYHRHICLLYTSYTYY